MDHTINAVTNSGQSHTTTANVKTNVGKGSHTVNYFEDYDHTTRNDTPVSPNLARPPTPSKPFLLTQQNTHLRLPASPDATSSKHVPAVAAAARSRPTTPPYISNNNNNKLLRRTNKVSGKSIPDAVLNTNGITMLGIGIEVEMASTSCLNSQSPTADTLAESADTTGSDDGSDPLNGKPKQEYHIIPPPLAQHAPSSIRSGPASPTSNASVPVGTTVTNEVSAGAISGHSKEEEKSISNPSSSEGQQARPVVVVQHSPSLPCPNLNATGSASTWIEEEPHLACQSSSSAILLSSDPSMPPPPPKDICTGDRTEFRRANNNGHSGPREEKVSLTAPTRDTQLMSTHSQATILKDYTSKPTFPMPKRSMTIGIPPRRLPLTIPPFDRRLSFREGSARLSPTLIIRPPPLPLINLPVLSPTRSVDGATVSGSVGSGDERRKSRMMLSMPSLPIQGSSRGTRGHEEVDDLEEEDDDDDTEGEDDEDIGEVSRLSSNDAPAATNYDSEASVDEENVVVEKRSAPSFSSQTPSRTSSYQTAREELSTSISESQSLNGDRLSVVDDSFTTTTTHLPRFYYETPSHAGDSSVDRSKVLDRKSIKKHSQSLLCVPNDAVDQVEVGAKGKTKKMLIGGGDDKIVFVVEDLARVSEVDTGTRPDTRSGGLKVVATPDVAQRYSFGSMVPEPSTSAGTKGTLLREPVHLEPSLSAGTSTGAKGSTILRRVEERATQNSFSSSKTPLGSSILYMRASKSHIDVHTIEMKERVEKLVRDQEEELRRKHSRLLKMQRKGNQGQISVPTANRVTHFEQNVMHPLRRRRSTPISDPPTYFAVFNDKSGKHLIIQPREDEGMERLPSYTNDIFLKAVMPRKMEFSSPGVQAKDRKWRRVLCVLDGTALKLYKCSAKSAGVSAIGEWWESKVGVGDPLADYGVRSSTPSRGSASGGALTREIEIARARKNSISEPLVQVETPPSVLKLQSQQKSAFTLAAQLLKPSATRHTRSRSETLTSPRRTSLCFGRGSTSGRTTPTTAQTTNDGSGESHSSHLTNSSRPSTPWKNGKMKGELADEGELIRVYTMQHAESGLGKDYTKRQHVIRVRLEGEQFLLQANGIESVIAWIEGLQSAANIALDLDERPMPTGPLLPRRRRRRRTIVASS